MTLENFIRDVLEFAIVVAVGAMIWASVKRLRTGKISPPRCQSCQALISRTYSSCPYCGADAGPSESDRTKT